MNTTTYRPTNHTRDAEEEWARWNIREARRLFADERRAGMAPDPLPSYPTDHSEYGWCWCQPDVIEVPPTGEVIVHRRTADGAPEVAQ